MLWGVITTGEAYKNQRQAGRVTPCAPGFGWPDGGAHGVTRPTTSIILKPHPGSSGIAIGIAPGNLFL